MMLGKLIESLESADQETVVPIGFHKPHSYRGFYDDLAFEPAENVTVASMLADARKALGSTYQGYKGGDFTMGQYTDVWLARYGRTGESIGPILLSYMLGKPSLEADDDR